MEKTSRGNRIHISIFGKRNVGKSSFLNKLTGQKISIVSDIAGTTTDPIEKPMELLPIGSVVFIDTAGVDDIGSLGKLRVEKTYEVLGRTDIAVIVCDYNGIDNYEIDICQKLNKSNIPIIVIINKKDIKEISNEKLEIIKKYSENILKVSAEYDNDITLKFKNKLIEILPEEFIQAKKILSDIIKEKDLAILVIPIDKEAPKGRIILPQVQTIREILDTNAQALVVKESELTLALENLKTDPKIVITDSQAFKEVSALVPENINLTSFSILFARLKGDLNIFLKGASMLDEIKNGDKILIYESCTHHPIEDDIARVKIPKWIKNYTKCDNLIYDYHVSKGFEKNIKDYKLIIQCGGCMTNRREILTRISMAQELNIPITNYGFVIAKCLGILNRAIKPFNLE